MYMHIHCTTSIGTWDRIYQNVDVISFAYMYIVYYLHEDMKMYFAYNT